MNVLRHSIFMPLLLSLAVIAIALTIRPPLPVDETRYLAIAWDMWLKGNYLVPHLNGAPYSHKPPLLFWLMAGGWHLFGVNEWWPRLVAPLFGFGSLILTFHLGRALWPESKETWPLAPILLFGSLFWCVFATLTMFDMLLAFFTLAAILSMVETVRQGSWHGFIFAGIAAGLGVLAKGPVILLHVIPVALTAPWWAPILLGSNRVFIKFHWYTGLGLTLIIATSIGLAWAIPASLAGGENYRDAILWGQSAGRMVKSFAHARPFWWYAAILPVLILPWLIWPVFWRAVRQCSELLGDGGIRLCLIWFSIALIIFSLISGKQLHYLLPDFPALALLAARLLVVSNDTLPASHHLDGWLPGGLAIISGSLLIIGPQLPLEGRLGVILSESTSVWGGLIIAAGVLFFFSRETNRLNQAARLASMTAFTVMAIYLAAAPVLAKRYDLRKMAEHISALEESGKAIAYFGKYHGQFHFMGRLKNRIPPIGLIGNDVTEFLAAHPDGVVIAKYDNLPLEADPLFTYQFRNYTYAAWPTATMIANPGLGDRR